MNIRDQIQTCDLLPSEDTTRRLLEICLELNRRVEDLEAEATLERILSKKRIANIWSVLTNRAKPD